MYTIELVLTECVVLVVFVGPPDGQETGRQSRKIAKLVGKGINSVDVIVSQPSGRRHAETQETDRQERHRFGGQGGQRHQSTPDAQNLSFVLDVALPPSVRLEFIKELPKGNLCGAVGGDGGFEHGDGFGFALWEAFVHFAGLFRVKAVHDLRGVAAVVPIDPVVSGGMGLSPSCNFNLVDNNSIALNIIALNIIELCNSLIACVHNKSNHSFVIGWNSIEFNGSGKDKTRQIRENRTK